MQSPLAGGSITTLAVDAVDTSGSGNYCIYVTPKYVYYFSYTTSAIRRVPIGGGTATTVVNKVYNGVCITADESYVYWTNSGDGSVNKFSLLDNILYQLAAAQAFPAGIVVDATNVYWATNYNGNGR